MTSFFRPVVIAVLVALAACSQPAPRALNEGSWALDAEASSLSFVSVKAGDVGEAHGFSSLAGSVSPAGKATLTIDLASVDTGIDIRNERMREFLFDVATYPQATVTAQVDPAAFAALKVGESLDQKLDASLELRGIQTAVEAEVTVLRAGPDRVVVSTARPIIIDAGVIELTDGLAKLQELAGLPSISTAVPVTFALSFARQ